jgi:hypothetical protein
VKVHILSGQSNMVGIGQTDGGDVRLGREMSELVLSLYAGAPDAAANNSIGPELGFGHMVGNHHEEPVLVLKASRGNRSLGWDPGSSADTIFRARMSVSDAA